MADFSVRSDNVDVEQIMRQIRARIREKRGVDYTEEEIRELASVKLEKFIDPKGVRSDLLEEYRRLNTAEEAPPNFAFEEDTLFETHRAPIRWLRALLRPFLKLLFNPNPLIQALHIQSDLNARNAQRHARVDALHYEVIHNLVLELTRTGIEVKSLKMRLESMASRLDFDERRARALEGVVQYRAGAVPPLQVPTGQEQGRRDQGQRNQGSRDQGPRDQGPRDQNQRGQGPRPQGQRPPQASAPRPIDQGPGAQGPGMPAPAPQVAGAPGLEGNALDADGNERRARRRRRRGRRRPGDRFGGEESQAGAGTGAAQTSGSGDASQFDSSDAGDAPVEHFESSGPSASSGSPDVPRSPEAPAVRQDFADHGNSGTAGETAATVPARPSDSPSES